jgi:hypothetical protein
MSRLPRSFCAFLLFLPVLCGCDLGNSQYSDPQLTSGVHGKQVAYPPNRSFSLELDLNADAGYSWYYVISDTTVLHLDSTRYRPKSGNWNLCGGMTVETFYFQTTTPGRCSIAMDEQQGWLRNVAPVSTIRFDVVVFR